MPKTAVQTQLHIGGEWVDAITGGTIPVTTPFDGSHLRDIAEARAEDVDRAVEATTAAQPARDRIGASERGRLIPRLADRIEAAAEELIALEARDTGHPARDARTLDRPRTLARFRHFGGMADKVEGAVLPGPPISWTASRASRWAWWAGSCPGASR